MNDPCAGLTANLLRQFGPAPELIPAFPIYERLTPELTGLIDRGGGWHLVLGEGGFARATIGQRQLVTRIEHGGAAWYSVQVSFLPLLLRSGRDYTVRFRARAEREQKMILDIAQIGTWYSYCPRTEYVVTPAWQDLRATFAMGAAPSEPNARFEFNLGACGPNEILFEDVAVEMR